MKIQLILLGFIVSICNAIILYKVDYSIHLLGEFEIHLPESISHNPTYISSNTDDNFNVDTLESVNEKYMPLGRIYLSTVKRRILDWSCIRILTVQTGMISLWSREPQNYRVTNHERDLPIFSQTRVDVPFSGDYLLGLEYESSDEGEFSSEDSFSYGDDNFSNISDMSSHAKSSLID